MYLFFKRLTSTKTRANSTSCQISSVIFPLRSTNKRCTFLSCSGHGDIAVISLAVDFSQKKKCPRLTDNYI